MFVLNVSLTRSMFNQQYFPDTIGSEGLSVFMFQAAARASRWQAPTLTKSASRKELLWRVRSRRRFSRTTHLCRRGRDRRAPRSSLRDKPRQGRAQVRPQWQCRRRLSAQTERLSLAPRFCCDIVIRCLHACTCIYVKAIFDVHVITISFFHDTCRVFCKYLSFCSWVPVF